MVGIPSTIKQYAQEDINAALGRVSHNMKFKSMTFETSKVDRLSNNYTVYATATILCPDLRLQFEFIMEYAVENNYVYASGDVDEFANSLEERYAECEDGKDGEPIKASTRIKRKPIMAADIDGEDEDEFVDTVDDLSDSVDDIQDTLDEIDGTEIEEDDVDIDLDNNIANHYIAECDTCHGIFISALVESDQEVEKVSGICPLCDKETDQYLKFIIRPVE